MVAWRDLEQVFKAGHPCFPPGQGTRAGSPDPRGLSPPSTAFPATLTRDVKFLTSNLVHLTEQLF